MSKQKTSTFIYDKLDKHPAVVAWNRLGIGKAKPCEIEVMKNHTKSKVYRIKGIGPKGEPIIAKQASRKSSRAERFIYQKVISHLSESTLLYYGTVDDENTNACWIFLEDAGDDQFAFNCKENRSLLIKWLAGLHMLNYPKILCEIIPDRGLICFKRHLHEASSKIFQNIKNSALRAEDIRILKTINSLLEWFSARWESIEKFCELFPKTLVHGDIKETHLRVICKNDKKKIFILDWEMAGIGFPAIDFGGIFSRFSNDEIDLYWSIVSSSWHNLTKELKINFFNIGTILRSIDAVYWAGDCLEYDYVDETMEQMKYYVEILNDMKIKFEELNSKVKM